MYNIHSNKAITKDGIEDGLFQICSDCKKEIIINMCDLCIKKLQFAKTLLQKEYWDS